MASFVRGSSIVFNVVFKDEDGEETLTTNASVYFSFRRDRENVSESVSLDQVGNTFVYTATWNSANAEPGEVFWHARGDGELGTIAAENSFVLTGNRANPDDD
jgi:hypothetical protein